MSAKKPPKGKEEGAGHERAEVRAAIYAPTEDILRRIKADIEKKGVQYFTPYTLAQAYNLKIGVAKRILKEAARRGILKLYSPGRRSPIYVPAKS